MLSKEGEKYLSFSLFWADSVSSHSALEDREILEQIALDKFHIAHVKASFNNTIVTITDSKGLFMIICEFLLAESDFFSLTTSFEL